MNCKEFPTGVFGCVSFSAKNTCIKCSEGRYLTNGLCRVVADNLKIDNCKYYDEEQEC